jgi:hypothetical protein
MDRVAVVLGMLLAFAWGPGGTLAQSKEGSAMTLKLTSTALAHGGQIPSKYTCEGQDISPRIPFLTILLKKVPNALRVTLDFCAKK